MKKSLKHLHVDFASGCDHERGQGDDIGCDDPRDSRSVIAHCAGYPEKAYDADETRSQRGSLQPG